MKASAPDAPSFELNFDVDGGQVGSELYGRFVGQIARRFSKCDLLERVTAFEQFRDEIPGTSVCEEESK